jgi:uncharacterized protein HemY
VARTLIILGLVLVAAGLMWPVLSRIGLGRLPGDLVIRRPGFSLYVPLATCLLASLVISALAWLLRR